jgi:bacterial leucyl aminopeptidase
MDITATQDTYPAVSRTLESTRSVKYPSKTAFNSTVKFLAKDLSKKNMRTHLETFTSFHTRYYKSSYGIQSAQWLFEQVTNTIEASGADKHGAFVRKVAHEWGQFSIIATIPGQSNKTIVIGAHQDSINLFLPAFLAAPGADDDGSGTVTILEALRVLLQSDDVIRGKADNTVEFHWYSAEEGGLLGSQAIFSEYSRIGRDVKAMLQQDMTGYVAKTLAAGEPESVGVITDFVDPGLTEFIKEVITTVSAMSALEVLFYGYADQKRSTATFLTYSPSADMLALTMHRRASMDIHPPL